MVQAKNIEDLSSRILTAFCWEDNTRQFIRTQSTLHILWRDDLQPPCVFGYETKVTSEQHKRVNIRERTRTHSDKCLQRWRGLCAGGFRDSGRPAQGIDVGTWKLGFAALESTVHQQIQEGQRLRTLWGSWCEVFMCAAQLKKPGSQVISGEKHFG